jgi:hypothetical protein
MKESYHVYQLCEACWQSFQEKGTVFGMLYNVPAIINVVPMHMCFGNSYVDVIELDDEDSIALESPPTETAKVVKDGATCYDCSRPATGLYFWNELPYCNYHKPMGYSPEWFSRLGQTLEVCLKEHRQRFVGYEIPDIDKNLVLPEVAANFYLLYDHSIDHPEDRELLDDFTKYLADNFLQYMTYSTAGELRHARSDLTPNSYLTLIINKVGRKHDVDVDWLLGFMSGTGFTKHRIEDRDRAFRSWKDVINKYGKAFSLDLCYHAFSEEDLWGGGDNVGGESWASIAKTALMYEQGETTPIIFVDTAFGLHHNGDIHFDKAWHVTQDLRAILDLNQAGKLELLKKWARPEVLEVINK